MEWDPRRWRSKYRALIGEGVRDGVASPWPSVEAQTVLGGVAMIEEVRTQIKEGHREIAGKRAWKRRRTFEEVVAVVEGHRGQRWGEFRDRRGDSGREMVWWLARRHAGMTLRELGEKAGRADYAAVGMALKRYELKMKKDPALRTETQMLERALLNVEI